MEEMEILKERAFFHWLYNIEGIGRRTIRRLMDAMGSAERIFYLDEEKLSLLLSPAQQKKLMAARSRAHVRQEYETLKRGGMDLYPASDPLYPKRLLPLPDRPEAIYVKGELPDERLPAVAVIGARVCSAYGAYMAEQFASALAAAGVCTISGLARGIDGIGQRAVVRAGGVTCAVLGCGPDICYPPENRQLYEGIVRHGAIISEYPPGTPPKAGLFPQRNRIISGLSDAVLVVEAKEQSGSLITANFALEHGHSVYALPGAVTEELSRGCNKLIFDGAGIAYSPEIMLMEWGIEAKNRPQNVEKKKLGLAPDLDLVYSGLDLRPENLDNLIRKTGFSASKVCALLTELQLMGLVGETGRQYYRISGG